MITVHTIAELREQLQQARSSNHRIGFVPTMGNLHDGHISLIERSKNDRCFTVASIFVNPLQFDDQSDLSRYPRTLADDQQKLQAADCDLLFAPDVDEMYPAGQAQQTLVHVPEVSEGLCGGSRPGHFDGVATVVSKLFNQVQPDTAYFGEKDYQQVAVIRKMVADLCMPVEIIPVATARAEDGLALSSRNGYLTEEERQQAPLLYQTLRHIAEQIQTHPINQVLKEAQQALDNAGFRTDYLEVRLADSLQPVADKSTLRQAHHNQLKVIILGAAFIGSARLIDNVSTTLNQDIE